MSAPGSSGGQLVHAKKVACLLGIHQGSASEFSGNNAWTVKHKFFKMHYVLHVLPSLSLDKLDQERLKLLEDFPASIDTQERSELKISAELAAFEVRGSKTPKAA
jgi:hypothetical protein